MVAKVTCQVTTQVDDGFPSPRVLYTGTTRRYICETFLSHGVFTHGDDTYLSLDQDAWTPMGYARRRSIFYKDTPVVLVVDTDKLKGELYYDGTYKTKALNIGSFLPYEVKLNGAGRLTMDDHLRIHEKGEQIQQVSQDEIWREFTRFLLKTS